MESLSETLTKNRVNSIKSFNKRGAWELQVVRASLLVIASSLILKVKPSYPTEWVTQNYFRVRASRWICSVKPSITTMLSETLTKNRVNSIKSFNKRGAWELQVVRASLLVIASSLILKVKPSHPTEWVTQNYFKVRALRWICWVKPSLTFLQDTSFVI